MTIPKYNFSIFEGDDKTLEFRYKIDGAPEVLTDYVIQLEAEVDSLDKTAIISDPSTGEFSFVFDRLDTENLGGKRIKYKVVFYDGGLSGVKTTKFTGAITVTTKGIS
jgi:hypothetical protein